MGKKRPRRKGKMKTAYLRKFSATVIVARDRRVWPEGEAPGTFRWENPKPLREPDFKDRLPFKPETKAKARDFHCILVKRNSERKLLLYFAGMEFFWVEEHPNDSYAKTSVLYWGRSSAMRAFDSNNILWAETYKLPDRST